MISKFKKFKKGFTLIELLVVVAIIGILSSITMASLNSARAKARDARRMSDLSQVRSALYLYFDKYGNWMEGGSGCGYNGNGAGWFSYVGGIYPKAMSQCLVDNNFTGGEIVDPTGGRTSSPETGFSYMKYYCNTPVETYIYAKLEGIPQSSTAVDGTCCSTCDSSYGMNYYISIK
jgi:prepilin-type N-terminal cleavage/methylation domain-containing protein